jgi:hypothetical protein
VTAEWRTHSRQGAHRRGRVTLRRTEALVGRRLACGEILVVEWSADYGDGRVYRNVTIAELQDGKAIRVTDYWGEPFRPPEWRKALAERPGMTSSGAWPAIDTLVHG